VNPRHHVTGYVLAGGRSTRLGRDKRFLRLDGRTLLAATARRIEAALGRAPALVGDDLPGGLPDARLGCGPLGGLVAALRVCPTDWALVLAVDLPRLSGRDLEALLRAAGSHRPLACLTRDGRPEPLAALYRRDTLPLWEERLAGIHYSFAPVWEGVAWEAVGARKGGEGLFNLNTEEDLRVVLG